MAGNNIETSIHTPSDNLAQQVKQTPESSALSMQLGALMTSSAAASDRSLPNSSENTSHSAQLSKMGFPILDISQGHNQQDGKGSEAVRQNQIQNQTDATQKQNQQQESFRTGDIVIDPTTGREYQVIGGE